MRLQHLADPPVHLSAQPFGQTLLQHFRNQRVPQLEPYLPLPLHFVSHLPLHQLPAAPLERGCRQAGSRLQMRQRHSPVEDSDPLGHLPRSTRQPCQTLLHDSNNTGGQPNLPEHCGLHHPMSRFPAQYAAIHAVLEHLLDKEGIAATAPAYP